MEEVTYEMYLDSKWVPFQWATLLNVQNDGKLNWVSNGEFKPQKHNLTLPCNVKRGISTGDAWQMVVTIRYRYPNLAPELMTIKIWVQALATNPGSNIEDWAVFPYYPVKQIAIWLASTPDDKEYYNIDRLREKAGLPLELANISVTEQMDIDERLDVLRGIIIKQPKEANGYPTFKNRQKLLEITTKHQDLAMFLGLINRLSRITMTIFEEFSDQLTLLSCIRDLIDHFQSRQELKDEVTNAFRHVYSNQRHIRAFGNLTKPPSPDELDQSTILVLNKLKKPSDMFELLFSDQYNYVPSKAAKYVYVSCMSKNPDVKWLAIKKQANRISKKILEEKKGPRMS